MKAVTPQWTPDPDGTHLTITLATEPPVSFRFDAKALEEYAVKAGHYRATLSPKVPLTPPNTRLPTHIDPRWDVGPDQLNGDLLLRFRDPRFGWLSYLIPRNTAEKLSENIREAMSKPPPKAHGSA